MKNVGFIGWRGMVGSVLMQRMVEERDFDAIRPVFFSTSQLGQAAPTFGSTPAGTLQDAYDLDALKALDIIVTCQGGDYTNEIYPKLRESGWQGYWIDLKLKIFLNIFFLFFNFLFSKLNLIS